MAEELGLGKVCRSCGKRSNTLGGVCPACRKPYLSGGLLDSRVRTGVVIVVLFCLAMGIGWLLITHFVAGVLLLAVAFVALVVAIGVANALAERGR